MLWPWPGHRRKTDDLAFPVRVLLQGLPGGFAKDLGPGRDPHIWLSETYGLGNAEFYGWSTVHERDGYALYTRSLADAVRFLEAFPEFKLADGTESIVYNSPHVTNGRRNRPYKMRRW